MQKQGSGRYAVPVKTCRFIVPEAAQGLRLDQCLARCVPGLSRRTARLALDIGAVFVANKRVKVSSRVMSAGQVVVVHLGGALERATRATGKEARTRDEAALPPLSVLFEDDDVVVVDKAAGVLSAPTPESDRNNLFSQLQSTGPRPQLFVVHRLDLQTSGVLIFAKSIRANQVLAETFRVHRLERVYSVLAAGTFPAPELLVTAPVRGKSSETHFRVLRQFNVGCLLDARLSTGRTHQIRIHLEGLGCPVLSDPQYGPKPSSDARPAWQPSRLALHARLLALQHPLSNEALHFESPLPNDLQTSLDQLEALEETR
jgi:23S rRNA pseudouridine1911/1915/1917 synthase